MKNWKVENMKKMGLHELISLTFDSDPKVRKQAAVELAKYDAPGAMFALVELTYDKDKNVQETARKLLDEAKGKEPEMMSFADVFSKGENGEKKEEKGEEERPRTTAREKMLEPIEKMFEDKLGKEQAKKMKKRMMPTLEKMYMRAMEEKEGGEREISKENKKVVEEMLEGYLDVVAGSGEKEIEISEPRQKSLAEELGLVSTKELKPDEVFKEVEKSSLEDESAVEEGPSPEEEWAKEKAEMTPGGTVFKFAFDTMMASKGDEKVMKKAMKKLTKNTGDQIKLAFDVAKKRYKELNITDITEIKSGMRNINTGALYVKSLEHKDYQRTKTKKDVFTRIVVADPEGSEGLIYLFNQRGNPIRPGMKLKLEKAYSKTFDWSGETAMTVSKKGKVYIIL